MEPIQPKIHSPNQQHATVDTREVPRASLLQYVDGSAWEVTYYSQVLGADQEPAPWALDRSATDQQYVRITNMELRVTSPLTSAEDVQGRAFDVMGTATVYPTHKPNVGDMFIADIGDGRAGVFAVTEVTRKTYLKDSFAEISYGLVNYITSRPEIEADLNRKSIKRAVFHKEFLHWGQNPQLLESEFADLKKMERLYSDLTNFYVKDFFSYQYRTLMIPGQSGPAYDPYLLSAVLDWITVDEVPALAHVRSPVVTANRNAESYTLWSALERMNASYLAAAVEKMRLLHTRAFRGLPEISSIYYTGIQYVACPPDPRTDVDAMHDGMSGAFAGGSMLGTTGLRWTDLSRYVPSPDSNGMPVAVDGQLPDILPVTTDEFYVLSEKFYRPNGPMGSKLEVLVKQALNQEPIDKVTLLKLAETCMKWPNLERFYYMPILFALMKVATRTN